ncbi:DUF262 domain-containing protein [Pyxidicoccus fallax]|uniref:DUF262 domain-containing protein n=1 Tax=Pyxidicoccus fallax TaxID=394095 RepID=A0A848L6B3_9BACT|nr:DUF262 domain-containing protein [Pyxidicoccus fallax]NMO14146.1 DUF262 domain-containing protein [Pyxidicoccus fallax]NPC80899.1 DUF262 domain-containing protein [Pyxidicoccus fallax]
MANELSYDSDTLTVEELFAPRSVAFEIPVYQRSYAWTQDEVGELLEDIYSETDDWLPPKEDESSYFLGSIVVQEQPESVRPALVLDGQQRLTTITLVLAVLEQKLRALSEVASADKIKQYLTAGKLGRQETPKIVLQDEDMVVYAQLLVDPRKVEQGVHRKTLLAKAFRTIDTYVEKACESLEPSRHSRSEVLVAMAGQVLYKIQFVRILAHSEAAAFRLFETLNDRGLPLNAADLVKNKLFAQSEQYLSEVRDLWGQVSDLVGAEEVVHFLRYFWIAFHEGVRKDRLYDRLRDHISKISDRKARDFVEELRDAAALYSVIAFPERAGSEWAEETREGLKRLVAFRARACRPVLLACARRFPGELPKLVRACEVVTVRYSVIGSQNPNQLEKAYDSFCSKLRKRQGDPLALFAEEVGPLVPDDGRFERSFVEVDIENVTATWRAILERLNDFVSTGETAIRGSNKVHVEHVLPRTLTHAVLSSSGLSRERAEQLVGKIGNLTLLLGSRNQTASNKPFSAKRPLFAQSDIFLTRELGALQVWGEMEIMGRTSRLFQIARDAWRWPMKD